MAGFTARAPCRVDLLGGTLDVRPLPALLGAVTTVNAALTIRATAEVRASDVWILEAEDIGARAQAGLLREIPANDPTRLLRTACLYSGAEAYPSHVRTRSDAPPNSGLGGSSAMLIALLGALDRRIGGPQLDPDSLPALAGAMEAHVLQAPTGLQDYYPATFGGVSTLVFGVGSGAEKIRNPGADEALDPTLVVAYTGLSHASGDLNWSVLKAVIDGDTAVRSRLERINEIAMEGCQHLNEGGISQLGAALDADWEARKGLAPGISTPECERMLGAARQAGAFGARLCGAGGGGCLVALASPSKRDAVKAALVNAGAQILDCAVDREGLVVEPIADAG